MFLKLLLLIFIKASLMSNIPNGHMVALFKTPTDFEIIVNLTSALIKEREIENFVIFSNRRHIFTEDNFDQILADHFQKPTITWGCCCFTARHRKIIGSKGLAFVQLPRLDDPLLDTVEQTLRDLHSMPMLFILHLKSGVKLSLLEIKRLFEWCWSHYLLNVVLLVQVDGAFGVQYQIYKFTPFPHITVQNVTASGVKERLTFIELRKLRVHGFKFFTLMYTSPYVFLGPDLSTCKHGATCPAVVNGIGGRFFKEYLRQINGTLEFALSNVGYFKSHKEMAALVSNRSIHIGIMPTSDLYVESTVAFGSYPIWHVNSCVIVPNIPEIFYGDYLKRSFRPTVWLLIISVIAGLIMLQRTNKFVMGSLRSNRISADDDPVTYVIGRLANQPISAATLRAHGPLYKFWQLLILIMCFVLINMYTTNLTSLLSTTIFDGQIDTLAEFLKSNLTLILSEDEKTTLLDNGRLPRELLQKAKVLDRATVINQKKTLNTTNAFVVASNFWDYIKLQQARLRKPVFRIASHEMCTHEFFVKFPMRRDSPFKASLTLFTMSALESGLAIKWNDMNIVDAVHFDYIKIFQEETPLWKPLCLEHYAWVFWICLLLWLFALMTFASEIISNRRQNGNP